MGNESWTLSISKGSIIMKLIVDYTVEDNLKALQNFKRGHYDGDDILVIQQILIDRLAQFKEELEETEESEDEV